MKKSVLPILILAILVTNKSKAADTSYQAWSEAEFSGELHEHALWQPHADPDGDQLDNLMEYALDSDPLFADAGEVPKAVWENGQLSFAFTRDSGKSDIVYRIEVSTDLKTWKRVPSEITSAKKGLERRLVRVSSKRAQGYIRLRVVPSAGAIIKAGELDPSFG